MCDKNTQILSQIDFEAQVNDEPEDEKTWARLYPIGSVFQKIDLKKDSTTFGRREDCDINLTQMETPLVTASAYSNLHFVLRREFTGKIGHHAMLEDKSSNGTFINGEKIGKTRTQALQNNSEISLSLKENKAYIFIDMSSNDDKNYPLEIRQKYTISKQLGVGAYGEVRLAFEKSNSNKFAVKIIQKKKFTMNGRHQLNSNKQIKSEIDILKKLDHPCITRVHEVIDTPDSVFIILDLAEGGELFDKVVKIGRPICPCFLGYFTWVRVDYEITNPCLKLEKTWTHRDLKPENILLGCEKNETLIKVTDFGLSKFFDATTIMKTFCGTPNYLAPEVLITRGEGKYTNKVDNWSLGVILYIILVGFPPFSDDNLETQIKRGTYDFLDTQWSSVSSQAKDVVKRLMCVDPLKRADLEEILQHAWLKNDFQMKEKAEKIMATSKSQKTVESNNKRELDTSSQEGVSNKRIKCE